MDLPIIRKNDNRGFILIHEKVELATEDIFSFWFYANKMGDQATKPGDYLVGTLWGNPYQDEKFKIKLTRWQGILNIKYPINNYQAVSRGDVKHYQRMEKEKRKNISLSRLYGKYQRRIEEIRKSGGLFINDEIELARNEYDLARLKIIDNYENHPNYQ